ncbi:MAG: hypothetical protein ACXWLH_00920 [Candidatus Saccharimonadales bacterium]
MDDKVLADLKQFIATTVSLQLAPIVERLDRLEQKVDSGFERLEQKVDDGFAGVGEALDTIHVQMDRDKAQTDARLITLEQKAA